MPPNTSDPAHFLKRFQTQGTSSPWRKARNRPGPGAPEPRTLNGHGDAQETGSATGVAAVGDNGGFADECRASILRAGLNRVLDEAGFDAFVEGLCSVFYASRMGQSSLRPGQYFWMLFIRYFERLSSERGIAWRVADSLSLRSFLDLKVTESARDHSTLSRTRRLIDVETHVAVVRQANWRRMAGESPAEGRSNQPPSPRVMRRSL